MVEGRFRSAGLAVRRESWMWSEGSEEKQETTRANWNPHLSLHLQPHDAADLWEKLVSYDTMLHVHLDKGLQKLRKKIWGEIEEL